MFGEGLKGEGEGRCDVYGLVCLDCKITGFI